MIGFCRNNFKQECIFEVSNSCIYFCDVIFVQMKNKVSGYCQGGGSLGQFVVEVRWKVRWQCWGSNKVDIDVGDWGNSCLGDGFGYKSRYGGKMLRVGLM